MNRMLIFTIITAILVFAAGCSLLKDAFEENEVLIETATRYATIKILDGDVEKAQDAQKLVNNVLVVIDDDSKSISLKIIEQYIVDQIDWSDMLPEEEALVRAIISAVRAEIEDRLTERGVEKPEEVGVEVRKILSWVYDSAVNVELRG